MYPNRDRRNILAQRVIAFIKKNWQFGLLVLIILFNAFWIIRSQFQNGGIKLRLFGGSANDRPLFQKARTDLYDMPCPEIARRSIRGESIDLRSLAGNVIIIRFSRFFIQDLPDVVFLQEVAEQQKAAGVHLILINSRGTHDDIEIEKLVRLSAPIIEDDGTFGTAFNAFPEDTIIIDRDFKIKFQSEKPTRRTIYDEIKKWTLGESPQEFQRSDEELSQALRDLIFYDVYKKERRKVSDFEGNLIVTVFSGICTGCQENSRIRLLRELSQRGLPKKGGILIIFGMRNTRDSVTEYAHQNGWDKLPITLGIAEEPSTLYRDSYYLVFSLDIDPKTYVIDSRGQVLLEESRKRSKTIKLETLIELIQ